jgi:hypothetical protein
VNLTAPAGGRPNPTAIANASAGSSQRIEFVKRDAKLPPPVLPPQSADLILVVVCGAQKLGVFNNRRKKYKL